MLNIGYIQRKMIRAIFWNPNFYSFQNSIRFIWFHSHTKLISLWPKESTKTNFHKITDAMFVFSLFKFLVVHYHFVVKRRIERNEGLFIVRLRHFCYSFLFKLIKALRQNIIDWRMRPEKRTDVESKKGHSLN